MATSSPTTAPTPTPASNPTPNTNSSPSSHTSMSHTVVQTVNVTPAVSNNLTVTPTERKRSSIIITPVYTQPKPDNQHASLGHSAPNTPSTQPNAYYSTLGTPSKRQHSSPDSAKEPYPYLNTPSTLARPGKKRDSVLQVSKPLPKPPGGSADQPDKSPGGSRITKKLPPPPKFATIVVKKFCPRSEKDEKEFNRVVMEIVQTEKDYVRDLQIILDVYIIPLEKGNIISKATVTSLFSNWRALLGINRELLNQMEILLEKLQAQKARQITKTNTPIGSDDSDQNKLLIRISFSSDHASKIIAIPNSYTGRQVVDLAISKVISSLPLGEQENFREKYNYCELYDENKAYNLDNIFVQQLTLKPSGLEPPQFSIRRSTKQPTNIGECFLHMAIYLKMYSEYCSNQVAAAKLLDKLKEENYNFFNFIDCCQFDNPLCRKLDLSSFLIIPMQRVCKYPLLLKRLLECTPENHLDYNSLTEASIVISEAVQAINDKKKEVECNERMFNLQSKIICPMKDLQIFAPSRRYISDGKVQYYEGTGLVDSFYFIFNDLSVITSLPDDKGRYRKRTHFETFGSLVDSELENVPLTVKITVSEESIFLTFDGLEEKQQFLTTLTNALNELRKERYNTWVAAQKAKGFTVSKTYESWLDSVLEH